MKQPYKAITLLCFSLIALTSNSICLAQTGAGWTASTSVSGLRIYNGDSIFGFAVDLNTIVVCPTSAANSSNSFRLLTDVAGQDNKLYAETYALLLSAQLSDKSVQLYRTGNCSGTHAIINGARLND